MTKEGKMIRLRASLFGFKKNDVHKYISNLEKQKNAELNELKESIAVITAENKMWEGELQELKDVLNKKLQQQKFMQYALDKAETQVRPLIIKTAENEIKNTSVMKEEEFAYNLSKNDFNEISEEDVCNLKDDLSPCLKINNNISREILLDDISEHIVEDIKEKKELENSTLNIEVLEKHNLEKESNKVELDYSNTDVFDGKQGTENRESEFIYDDIENIKEFQAETINDDSNRLIEIDNDEQNSPTPSVEISNTNNSEVELATSFWEEENEIKSFTSFWDEEFEEFLEGEKVQELSEAKDFLEIKETPSEQTIENKDESMENIGFSFCNRNNELNKVEESNDDQENKNKIYIENKPIESEAITREIKNIRSKYLIGKIVGKDLLDRQGRLIVKRGSVITENIIEIVNKEGKLAELILDMILPETSE